MSLSRRELIASAGAGLLMGVSAWEACAMDDFTEMVRIPAGKFRMGTPRPEAERLAKQYGFDVSWLSGEYPAREIELPAYYIDRYPVTNRQFAAFCRATGYAPRPHWNGAEPPANLLDHPVTFVHQPDAEAYARWAGKRLPTEAEWEKAARGEKGLLYPWGDTFNPDACQWNREDSGDGPGTAPVNAHPAGASPYGVMDMAGNVAEWCADRPGPPTAFLKGGCWKTVSPINLRPAARNMSGWATNVAPFYGFRCVREER
jgi:formylglycine-generating enzyme required for sulfatase activity